MSLGGECQLLQRPDIELHGRLLSAAPRKLTFIGDAADDCSPVGGEACL